MAGISSKALSFGEPENKKKYNGIEKIGDFGLEDYDAQYRELDPQIGRWWEIDPKTENQESTSPYASMSDNPISQSDPLGDEDGECCKEVWNNIVNTVEKTAADVGQGLLGAVNAFTSDNVGGVGRVDGSNLSTAFQIGQKVGDGVAVVSGAIEDVVAGGGEILTVGGSTAVSVPLAIHGTATAAVAIKNLATQKMVSNGNSSSNDKQRNKPQQNGTPNSSKIESKDANGKTTKYSTYGKDGQIKKQVQAGNGGDRHGNSGATKKVPNYNTDPQTGKTYINGYKIKKAMPAETPPGTN
jgi:RHS repeat-associated protein